MELVLWSSGSLGGDREIRGNRIEVERFAYEIAKRDDKLVGVNGSFRAKVPRRAIGESDMVLGT